MSLSVRLRLRVRLRRVHKATHDAARFIFIHSIILFVHILHHSVAILSTNPCSGDPQQDFEK